MQNAQLFIFHYLSTIWILHHSIYLQLSMFQTYYLYICEQDLDPRDPNLWEMQITQD